MSLLPGKIKGEEKKTYMFVRQIYHRNGVVCNQYGEGQTTGVVQTSNIATSRR